MIEVTGLTVSKHTILFSNFSYYFKNGQLYLITAENGSGKTTLLRALVNLIKVDSGTVSIDSKPLSDCKDHIFYWESNDWLNTQMSGRDYLEFVKYQWGSKVDINPVIKYWNMEKYISIPIKKYSLGMKQRLIIAMYEISNANTLLMDEISNGLDEDARRLLYRKLRLLVDGGKCIIITSHYKDEIINISDKQLFFKHQEIREVVK